MPALSHRPRASASSGTPNAFELDEPELGLSNAEMQARLAGPVTAEALAAMTPDQRRERLEGLGDAEKQAIVAQNPQLIGNMDGVPVAMRYSANRLLVGAEVQRLTAALSQKPDDKGLARRLEAVKKLAGSQLLRFDPKGDGGVVEVFGDLETADNVSVVVPGVGNDLDNYDSQVRPMAENLQESTDALTDKGVATISYLYDTPTGLDEIGKDPIDVAKETTNTKRADAVAGDLTNLVGGLGLKDETQLTAVGHSYGSVVIGQAMHDHGFNPDDAVFMGSPGLGVGGKDELLRKDDKDPSNDLSTETWAGRAALDAVAMGTKVAPLFGPQPQTYADHEVETGGVLGHGNYFDKGSESLENVARIAAGHEEQVTEEKDPAWKRDGGAVLNKGKEAVGGAIGGAVDWVKKKWPF